MVKFRGVSNLSCLYTDGIEEVQRRIFYVDGKLQTKIVKNKLGDFVSVFCNYLKEKLSFISAVSLIIVFRNVFSNFHLFHTFF